MEFKKKLSFYTLKSYFIHFNIPFYNSPNILILILHIKTNTIHIFNLFFSLLLSYILSLFLSFSPILYSHREATQQPQHKYKQHHQSTNNQKKYFHKSISSPPQPIISHHHQIANTHTTARPTTIKHPLPPIPTIKHPPPLMPTTKHPKIQQITNRDR